MYYNFHFSSVTKENKLSNGSGNAGVCENTQAGPGVGAVAGTGKKSVCVKAALGKFVKYGHQGIVDTFKKLTIFHEMIAELKHILYSSVSQTFFFFFSEDHFSSQNPRPEEELWRFGSPLSPMLK